jgi:hypothetical protein
MKEVDELRLNEMYITYKNKHNSRVKGEKEIPLMSFAEFGASPIRRIFDASVAGNQAAVGASTIRTNAFIGVHGDYMDVRRRIEAMKRNTNSFTRDQAIEYNNLIETYNNFNAPHATVYTPVAIPATGGFNANANAPRDMEIDDPFSAAGSYHQHHQQQHHQQQHPQQHPHHHHHLQQNQQQNLPLYNHTRQRVNFSEQLYHRSPQSSHSHSNPNSNPNLPVDGRVPSATHGSAAARDRSTSARRPTAGISEGVALPNPGGNAADRMSRIAHILQSGPLPASDPAPSRRPRSPSPVEGEVRIVESGNTANDLYEDMTSVLTPHNLDFIASLNIRENADTDPDYNNMANNIIQHYLRTFQGLVNLPTHMQKNNVQEKARELLNVNQPNRNDAIEGHIENLVGLYNGTNIVEAYAIANGTPEYLKIFNRIFIFVSLVLIPAILHEARQNHRELIRNYRNFITYYNELIGNRNNVSSVLVGILTTNTATAIEKMNDILSVLQAPHDITVNAPPLAPMATPSRNVASPAASTMNSLRQAFDVVSGHTTSPPATPIQTAIPVFDRPASPLSSPIRGATAPPIDISDMELTPPANNDTAAMKLSFDILQGMHDNILQQSGERQKEIDRLKALNEANAKTIQEMTAAIARQTGEIATLTETTRVQVANIQRLSTQANATELAPMHTVPAPMIPLVNIVPSPIVEINVALTPANGINLPDLTTTMTNAIDIGHAMNFVLLSQDRDIRLAALEAISFRFGNRPEHYNGTNTMNSVVEAINLILTPPNAEVTRVTVIRNLFAVVPMTNAAEVEEWITAAVAWVRNELRDLPSFPRKPLINTEAAALQAGGSALRAASRSGNSAAPTGRSTSASRTLSQAPAPAADADAESDVTRGRTGNPARSRSTHSSGQSNANQTAPSVPRRGGRGGGRGGGGGAGGPAFGTGRSANFAMPEETSDNFIGSTCESPWFAAAVSEIVDKHSTTDLQILYNEYDLSQINFDADRKEGVKWVENHTFHSRALNRPPHSSAGIKSVNGASYIHCAAKKQLRYKNPVTHQYNLMRYLDGPYEQHAGMIDLIPTERF